MKRIGFIPIRKGSKGIKNKNTRKMVGRPLYTWVLSEAIFSELDEVIVYTDDQLVIEFVEREYSWTKKVKAVMRSEKSATDTASTELAILEFCDQIDYNFDIFCLLQATSPFTTRTDINNCLNEVEKNNFDSALTVVNTHRFIWNDNGEAVNYDIYKRPRRQDFDGILVENGAVYITTKESLKATRNRIGGKISTVKMPEESLFEIDSENDWVAIEQLLIRRQKQSREAKKITHLILDVDGVFTAGTITYTKDGEFSKEFDMRDGMGLEILRELNVEVIVMTSEKSELVAQRMKKLNIENTFLGVKDKYALLNNILLEKSISISNIAYVGDDVNDLTNICSVGWSLTPNNAMDVVKRNADVVLSKDSGNGAIREACNFIMNYNKRFN